MSKGIVGNLLPEQVKFFSEQQDLAEVIKYNIEEFEQPYHLYIDGVYKESLDEIGWDEASDIGRDRRDDDGGRMVLLDNAGAIVQESHPAPRIAGNFHLVYSQTVSDKNWVYFLKNNSESVYESESGAGVLAINAEEFAKEDFSEAPAEMKEFVENLQEIAKLYPLMKIDLYY